MFAIFSSTLLNYLWVFIVGLSEVTGSAPHYFIILYHIISYCILSHHIESYCIILLLHCIKWYWILLHIPARCIVSYPIIISNQLISFSSHNFRVYFRVSDCLIPLWVSTLWELPSPASQLPLDDPGTRLSIWALELQSLKGRRARVSLPSPDSLTSRWSGESNWQPCSHKTPPQKPSGHSCPRRWLVISSRRKLDARKHKEHSRCLKCHNTTMQVADWQRGRFRSSPLPESIFLQVSHAQMEALYHLLVVCSGNYEKKSFFRAHILFISLYSHVLWPHHTILWIFHKAAIESDHWKLCILPF